MLNDLVAVGYLLQIQGENSQLHAVAELHFRLWLAWKLQ